MGAFFLYHKRESFREEAVRDVYRTKQFEEPERLDLGEMRAWVYRKQLQADDEIVRQGDDLMVVDGTLIYRGLGIAESRRRFFDDLKQDRVDCEQLYGSFCVLLYVDGKLTVMLDPMHLYHLFVNDAGTILSSSFLALVESGTKPFRVNRSALLENLTTGVIIGPDTLVHGIRLVTRSATKQLTNANYAFKLLPLDLQHGDFCEGSRSECVEGRLADLSRSVREVAAAAEQYGADLGLSGGYDSRLLAALSDRVLPVDPVLHSHATEGVHTVGQEKSAAERVAAVLTLPIRSISSLPPNDMSGEKLEANLFDSMYYFDGRCNHGQGNHHETNTRSYRIRVLQDRRFGLNGLVGEIFRNFDLNIRQRLSFRHWMRLHHVYPGFTAAFDSNRKTEKQLFDYVVDKIDREIDVGPDDVVDRFKIRRMIGEVKNRYNYAIKANAEIQLADFYIPYSQPQVVRSAYKATPFIGLSGRFQAEMIEHVNPAVAGQIGYMGFPPNKEPLSYRAKRLIFGQMPKRAQLYKQNRFGWNFSGELHPKVLSKSDEFRQSIELVCAVFPSIHWDRLLWGQQMFSASVFIGTVLRRFNIQVDRV